MTVKSAILAAACAAAGVSGPLLLGSAESSAMPARSGTCLDAPRPGQHAHAHDQDRPAGAKRWPKWLYNEWRDEAGTGRIRYAELVSESPRPAAPGFSGPKLVLTLRKGGAGDDVILTVSEGQFDCPGAVCEINARFDGGEPHIYTAEPAQSSRRAVTLVEDEHEFVQNIKQADTLLLKTTLRTAANCEFAFNTAGLRWP